MFVAIGQQDVGAIADGVIAVGAVEGVVDDLGTDIKTEL